MKKLISILVIIPVVLNCFAQEEKNGINHAYKKAAKLQSVMDSFAKKGLPGISVAVYTDSEGWWADASGFNNVEEGILMKTSDLQYIQSVSKVYMATVILMLSEEGRLQLSDPITRYLPKRIAGYIKNADEITLKMLLNHTSGVAEYVSDPEYTTAVLLTPLKVVDMGEVLQCLKNENAQFAPGKSYNYTNTNYTLLAMIADVITGDHSKYMADKIFKPLGLKQTFYRNTKNYISNPALVSTYWDLLNTGRPANISAMQKANVSALIGDDGIICTPIDVIKFMRGLMEGKLISDSSLKLMKQWVKNKSGYEIYGLGLAHMLNGELDGVGHGGGGIGAGCALLYVPSKKSYIFLATNIGVIWEGQAALIANAMKEEVWKAVLQ